MWTAAFLCIAAAALIYQIVRWLFGKLKISDLDRRAVLITGCDSGFGRLLALKCLRHGMPTFASFQTHAGQTELEPDAAGLPGKLYAKQLDITKPESVQSFYKFVSEKLVEAGLNGLWGLVNNAGIAGVNGPDDWLTVEDYRSCLEVNCLGAIRMSQTFKPLVKKAKGRVVIITSVTAILAHPTAGPYSVSKYAIEGYADILRRELALYRVSVHILSPGYFRTRITDPEKAIASDLRTWSLLPQEVKDEYGEDYLDARKRLLTGYLGAVTSPRLDFVVDAYFHALTSRLPKTRYYPGYDALLFYHPMSHMPEWIQDGFFNLVATLTRHPLPQACR